MHSSFHALSDGRSVCLVLPGLLSAEAVGSTSMPTPGLCRILSQVSVSHSKVESLESIVLKWFHGDIASKSNCAAGFGYEAEIQKPVNASVMRADPVFQQMDINHAVLADQSILDLELSEARAIAKTLNQHFIADGLSFELTDAYRWYCCFKLPLDIHTSSPGESVGRDVSMQSPTGADASKWRGILAEIEMLLYSHPVNEQRQMAGKVPVNSLWLWGEGAPQVLQADNAGVVKPAAAIYSNNFYTKSISRYLKLSNHELADFSELRPLEQNVLLVDDRLKRAAATADIDLRLQVLLELEQQVFEPLWRMLGRSGIRRVRIWAGGGKWMQLDAAARYKFWRRPKPLQYFIDNPESISHDH